MYMLKMFRLFRVWIWRYKKPTGLQSFLDHSPHQICRGEWLIDLTTALNVLKLAELQNRLNPGSAHQSDLPRAKAVGDVDLF